MAAEPGHVQHRPQSCQLLWNLEDLGRWSASETTTLFLDVAAHFLLSLRSPHTRRNYARDLAAFISFCESLNVNIKDIRDITEKQALLWRTSLEKQHTKFHSGGRRVVQSSVARPLCALSSLFTFAVRRNLIDRNPVALVARPKVRRESKTNALTEEEVSLLLHAAEAAIHTARQINQRAYASARLRHTLICTLLSVGMRVDELCELRIGDLERTPQFTRLHMTAKGGETHSPIIHERTAQMLSEYIMEFRAHCSVGDFLFIRAQKTHQDKKLTQAAVYLMVTQLAKHCSLEKKLSPHSCRATLATLLHNSNVPIAQIQDLLNHKQITTTAIYIKKSQELKEAAATKIDITAL